jgi:hypothetical protein
MARPLDTPTTVPETNVEER